METSRKHSRKRSAILEVLRNTDLHPGAEWIYAKLKPDYPDLSLGTVYRNLALFRESGDIISVGTVRGVERFDGNTAQHTHFVCCQCGRVLDVAAAPAGGDCTCIERLTGGRVTACQLTYFGVCADCRTDADNKQ